jgi:hypothetical protein
MKALYDALKKAGPEVQKNEAKASRDASKKVRQILVE